MLLCEGGLVMQRNEDEQADDDSGSGPGDDAAPAIKTGFLDTCVATSQAA